MQSAVQIGQELVAAVTALEMSLSHAAHLSNAS